MRHIHINNFTFKSLQQKALEIFKSKGSDNCQDYQLLKRIDDPMQLLVLYLIHYNYVSNLPESSNYIILNEFRTVMFHRLLSFFIFKFSAQNTLLASCIIKTLEEELSHKKYPSTKDGDLIKATLRHFSYIINDCIKNGVTFEEIVIFFKDHHPELTRFNAA